MSKLETNLVALQTCRFHGRNVYFCTCFTYMGGSVSPSKGHSRSLNKNVPWAVVIRSYLIGYLSVDSPDGRDTVSNPSRRLAPAFKMDLKLFRGRRENRPTNNDFVHQAATARLADKVTRYYMRRIAHCDPQIRGELCIAIRKYAVNCE